MPAEGGELVEPGREVLFGASEAVHQEQRALPGSGLGDPKSDLAEVYVSFCHHGPVIPNCQAMMISIAVGPADSTSGQADPVTDSKVSARRRTCSERRR